MTQTDAPAPSGAGPASASLAGFVFLGLATARPRRTLAAILLMSVLAGAFAGCLDRSPSAQPQANPSLQPTVEATIEERADLAAAGHGAIEGTVREEAGLPVAGSNVALLGTDLSTQSAKNGAFTFKNVSAGGFRIRFDAAGFMSVEQDIRVETGKVTLLNVTLVRPGGGVPANLRAHTHDEWGAQTRLNLIDDTVTYRADRPGGFACWGPGLVLYQQQCDTPIPFPSAARVLPGSTQMEIILSWEAQLGLKELQVRVETARNRSATQTLVARPSGDAFRLAFFPDEADSGHQTFTSWKLFLRPVWPRTHFAPVGPIADYTFQVQVRVDILKGVVPYEPAHRSFWNGANQIRLFNEEGRAPACVPCDYPRDAADVTWVPGDAVFVPPGTKEVSGYLRWTHGALPPGTGTDWILVYRSADMSDKEWKRATMSGAGSNKTFVIPLNGEMADQFYQHSTEWVFGVDDQAQQTPGIAYSANTAYTTRWFLTAAAIKDPGYEEEAPEPSA